MPEQPPTEEPVVLRAGDASALVHPDVGGRLGQLTVGGHDFLRPGDETTAWHQWGSFPLLPWSNRIADGVLRFRGRSWEMPVRFTDGSAIHGLVHSAPWRIDATGPAHVELSVRIVTQPYDLRAHQRYALSAASLVHEVGLRNSGDEDVPVGLGIHPWFAAGPVSVPAAEIWPTVGALPTGAPRAVLPDEDLRSRVVPPVMDSCYTGLTDTVATVGALTLSWRGPVEHVVVFTGVPGWVCVEPVTNANDGFNLLERGEPRSGVIVLRPGEETSVAYELSWPAATGARGDPDARSVEISSDGTGLEKR
jgi:aldose 1-epimerase